MPLPRSFRRVPRTLNPAMMPLARRVRPLAIVHTVGRRTGRAYRNPVLAFRLPAGGWITPLTYGADVPWVRNALAAGAVRVVESGVVHENQPVRLVGAGPVPMWARPAMRAVGVRDYLMIGAVL